MSNLKPFVKWAGGKRQLLNRLQERLPDKYNCYYEPFVGGGALFLRLAPKKAVINDVNVQLINVYKQLKRDPEPLISLIKGFDSTPCNKEYYYRMRERYNEKIKNQELDAECAALTIWINKHCYNGLYRVNTKGLFNVPYNNKESGQSMDEDNLRDIGKYLQTNDIDIRVGDFEDVCKEIKAGDFVYFDSPYIPVSKTASFTDYTKDGFSYDDHCRLAKAYKALSQRGVKALLSNHNVDLVYELYSKFKIEPISVKRAINSDASKRVGKEVIIKNY